jgi:tRNA pseudouridine38-40 synthase
LDVSYDGTEFSGWAAQPGLRTVQSLVEDALEKQPPGASVAGPVVVAGRTDAGVHASGQVIHVDVAPLAGKPPHGRIAVNEHGIFDLQRMQYRWNSLLPRDVRVLDARIAPPGFDARFSAVRRHYRYQVSDASWGVAPLQRHNTLAWGRALSVDRMNEASLALLGLQDFAAYCKQRAGATTVRELQRLTWHRTDRHTVVAEVSADAFCHSMVRSLVGVLLLVGDGRRGLKWPAEVLDSRVRGSVVAPARGLTLVAVDYPPDSQLAARAKETRNIRTRNPSPSPDGCG